MRAAASARDADRHRRVGVDRARSRVATWTHRWATAVAGPAVVALRARVRWRVGRPPGRTRGGRRMKLSSVAGPGHRADRGTSARTGRFGLRSRSGTSGPSSSATRRPSLSPLWITRTRVGLWLTMPPKVAATAFSGSHSRRRPGCWALVVGLCPDEHRVGGHGVDAVDGRCRPRGAAARRRLTPARHRVCRRRGAGVGKPQCDDRNRSRRPSRRGTATAMTSGSCRPSHGKTVSLASDGRRSSLRVPAACVPESARRTGTACVSQSATHPAAQAIVRIGRWYRSARWWACLVARTASSIRDRATSRWICQGMSMLRSRVR
jgi:hypothetical protein